MKLYKSTAVRFNELCLPIYHIYPACAVFPENVEQVEVDTRALLKTEICRVCRRMHEQCKGEIVPTLGKVKPAKPRNGLKCVPLLNRLRLRSLFCSTLILLLFVSATPAQWCQYRPQGAQGGTSIFNDVLTHCNQHDARRLSAKYPDRVTCCHEVTHFVNNDLDKCLQPGYQGFYTCQHRAYILRAPRITLSQVAVLVDSSQRDDVYKLYLVQLRSSNDQVPLVILDEFSAYINGAKCAKDERIGNLQSELKISWQFVHFSECLVRAIRQHDPQYDQLPQLEYFIKYERDRLAAIGGPAR